MRSPELKAINQKYEWMFKYLSNWTKESVEDVVTVDYIFDTLWIEQRYNKTLPSWTSKVFPDPMKYLRDFSFKINTWTHELKRLTSGTLVDAMVSTFKAVRDGKMDPVERKMIMFSAHDTTLASLLNTLEYFDPPIAPPYASMVSVELWKKASTNSYYVTFQYRNDTTREPYQFTVNGCDLNCPLDKFDSLTANLRPADWEQECGLKSVDVEKVGQVPVNSVTTFGMVFIFVFLVLSLIAGVAAKICQQTSKNNEKFEDLINHSSQKRDMDHTYVAVGQEEDYS